VLHQLPIPPQSLQNSRADASHLGAAPALPLCITTRCKPFESRRHSSCTFVSDPINKINDGGVARGNKMD